MPEHLLGEILPPLGQVAQQLLGGLRSGVVLAYTAVNLVPDIFNWIKIRTAGWPVEMLNALLLKERLNNPCPVHWGVVVLEDALRSNAAQQG